MRTTDTRAYVATKSFMPFGKLQAMYMDDGIVLLYMSYIVDWEI